MIFQGEVGVGGAVKSMRHAPKVFQFENWNLVENCFTRNTSNATK